MEKALEDMRTFRYEDVSPDFAWKGVSILAEKTAVRSDLEKLEAVATNFKATGSARSHCEGEWWGRSRRNWGWLRKPT